MEVGEPAFFRVATRRLRAAIISSGGRGTVTESANVAFAVRVGLAKEPAPNGVHLVPTAWPSSPGLDARPPKSAVTVVWYLFLCVCFERRSLARRVWVHGDPRAEPLETSA